MSIVLSEEFQSLLDSDVKSAIELASNFANENNYAIYLIGGIVRDMIMGNKIKDIDIAVEADAIDFATKLCESYDCELVAVQEKLRTSKVKFKSGIEIDFASTREEKYSESGVLPVAYNFGCSLKEDVKRRDFTINTLAMKLTGEDKYYLVDFYNGYDDIQNKKIKILHGKSFIDDPSRIIRALKFQVRFDFSLDLETKNLMDNYLLNVDEKMPLERIKSELRQYFSISKENNYEHLIINNAYKLISDNPIMEIDISRISKLLQFELYDKSEFWFLMIACLIVNSDFAIDRLNMTSFERKIIEETRELLNEKKIKLNDNERIYKLYNDKIDLSLALFYLITGEESVIKFLTVLKQIKVLITGGDLIELGLIPSAFFSEIFDKVLKEKLKGKLKKKQDEIKFVQKLIKKQSR